MRKNGSLKNEREVNEKRGKRSGREELWIVEKCLTSHNISVMLQECDDNEVKKVAKI
jgi:hypothetical protein